VSRGALAVPGPPTPPGWTVRGKEGWGPFVTQVIWETPEGETVTWSSRWARKRLAPARLARMNLIAAVAFTIGGSLFAIGAAIAQLGSGDATTCASIYFVGGVFFSTGGYATLVAAINAPRAAPGAGPEEQRWRWWSYEPHRIDWLSAAVLFAGTLAFGVSLTDSFLQGLTTQQVNRLIWAPDLIGCTMFLISGHLALMEVCHGHLCVRRRELGWWVAALNQIGSWLFMISALGAFTNPETASQVNVAVANWGTLTGALCFAVGGVVQAFERPA
jgi:hypothetical protein